MTTPMMDSFTAVRHGDVITFTGSMWAPATNYELVIEPSDHDNSLTDTYPLSVGLRFTGGFGGSAMTPTESTFEINDPSGKITKIRVYNRENRSYEDIDVVVGEAN